MGKYDSMPKELKDYANKRIAESGIRTVPGHYPVFESKEHVDMWIDMVQKIIEKGKEQRNGYESNDKRIERGCRET